MNDFAATVPQGSRPLTGAARVAAQKRMGPVEAYWSRQEWANVKREARKIETVPPMRLIGQYLECLRRLA